MQLVISDLQIFFSRIYFIPLIVTTLFLSRCKQGTIDNEILPIPSKEPSSGQAKMIERKYGMFIHFGINTFHDMEWTDGSLHPLTYNPSTLDPEQWIRTAKDAGMKYIILVAKHHEGFCLWDSKYTEYDVANSGNGANVVEQVAKACKKYNIGLGLYYSLWDRNFNGNDYPNGDQYPHKYGENPDLDKAYNDYMINQLNELIDITEKYIELDEVWFDGGWVKENKRWPLKHIYKTIKSREPQCQIGINWSIGLPNDPDYHPVYPKDQREGYPIRYFPSDFRLGDPYLPVENDPKIFTHEGKEYYMPWESTVCISDKWFYNTTDTVFKPVDQLAYLYKKATANDNILILNCPPSRDGLIREKDNEILLLLKEELELK